MHAWPLTSAGRPKRVVTMGGQISVNDYYIVHRAESLRLRADAIVANRKFGPTARVKSEAVIRDLDFLALQLQHLQACLHTLQMHQVCMQSGTASAMFTDVTTGVSIDIASAVLTDVTTGVSVDVASAVFTDVKTGVSVDMAIAQPKNLVVL